MMIVLEIDAKGLAGNYEVADVKLNLKFKAETVHQR